MWDWRRPSPLGRAMSPEGRVTAVLALRSNHPGEGYRRVLAAEAVRRWWSYSMHDGMRRDLPSIDLGWETRLPISEPYKVARRKWKGVRTVLGRMGDPSRVWIPGVLVLRVLAACVRAIRSRWVTRSAGNDKLSVHVLRDHDRRHRPRHLLMAGADSSWRRTRRWTPCREPCLFQTSSGPNRESGGGTRWCGRGRRRGWHCRWWASWAWRPYRLPEDAVSGVWARCWWSWWWNEPSRGRPEGAESLEGR